MGTAILRRYVLLGPIGHGGVSTVYHAIDTVRGQPLAIKLLDPVFADDLRARRNMYREAEVTALLRHPSVPRVYDCGDARLPDGTLVPYVVLELLNGVGLSGRLAGGPLPWREAVAMAATIADVLAVAHRRGVVHRDLTPANIMLTTNGVKIIDFGLATTVDTERDGVAECAEDVHALGILLYQMLTGRSPYPLSRTVLTAARLRSAAPTPVLVVPGMPRAVADICRDCMAKRPGDRPDSTTVALALWSEILDSYRPPLPSAAIVR
jgi:serine/threonine-protein kinase